MVVRGSVVGGSSCSRPSSAPGSGLCRRGLSLGLVLAVVAVVVAPAARALPANIAAATDRGGGNHDGSGGGLPAATPVIADAATPAIPEAAMASPSLDVIADAATPTIPEAATSSPSLDVIAHTTTPTIPEAATASPSLDVIAHTTTPTIPEAATASPSLDVIAHTTTPTIPEAATASPSLDVIAHTTTPTIPEAATASPSLDDADDLRHCGYDRHRRPIPCRFARSVIGSGDDEAGRLIDRKKKLIHRASSIVDYLHRQQDIVRRVAGEAVDNVREAIDRKKDFVRHAAEQAAEKVRQAIDRKSDAVTHLSKGIREHALDTVERVTDFKEKTKDRVIATTVQTTTNTIDVIEQKVAAVAAAKQDLLTIAYGPTYIDRFKGFLQRLKLAIRHKILGTAKNANKIMTLADFKVEVRNQVGAVLENQLLAAQKSKEYVLEALSCKIQHFTDLKTDSEDKASDGAKDITDLKEDVEDVKNIVNAFVIDLQQDLKDNVVRRIDSFITFLRGLRGEIQNRIVEIVDGKIRDVTADGGAISAGALNLAVLANLKEEVMNQTSAIFEHKLHFVQNLQAETVNFLADLHEKLHMKVSNVFEGISDLKAQLKDNVRDGINVVTDQAIYGNIADAAHDEKQFVQEVINEKITAAKNIIDKIHGKVENIVSEKLQSANDIRDNVEDGITRKTSMAGDFNEKIKGEVEALIKRQIEVVTDMQEKVAHSLGELRTASGAFVADLPDRKLLAATEANARLEQKVGGVLDASSAVAVLLREKTRMIAEDLVAVANVIAQVVQNRTREVREKIRNREKRTTVAGTQDLKETVGDKPIDILKDARAVDKQLEDIVDKNAEIAEDIANKVKDVVDDKVRDTLEHVESKILIVKSIEADDRLDKQSKISIVLNATQQINAKVLDIVKAKTDIKEDLAKKIKDAIDESKDRIRDSAIAIANASSSFRERLMSAAGAKVDAVGDTFEAAANTTRRVVGSVAKKASRAVSWVWSSFASIAHDVKEIKRGVSSAIFGKLRLASDGLKKKKGEISEKVQIVKDRIDEGVDGVVTTKLQTIENLRSKLMPSKLADLRADPDEAKEGHNVTGKVLHVVQTKRAIGQDLIDAKRNVLDDLREKHITNRLLGIVRSIIDAKLQVADKLVHRNFSGALDAPRDRTHQRVANTLQNAEDSVLGIVQSRLDSMESLKTAVFDLVEGRVVGEAVEIIPAGDAGDDDDDDDDDDTETQPSLEILGDV